MNELQIFDNPEFGKIRGLMLDGDPWFVGKDVAGALGYSNPRKALGDHVDDADKGVTKRDTLGGMQNMTIINESGLYSLILSSKLPTAKRFKRWVTSEVLPAIRKTGRYEMEVPAAPTRYAPTRPLTSDDYMDAGKAIARCDNRRLPIVLDLFRKAGLDIQKVTDIQKKKNHEESDNEYFIGLLNQYGLNELTEKLGICRSSIYYYRIGKYKPNKKRKELIIKILTEDGETE